MALLVLLLLLLLLLLWYRCRQRQETVVMQIQRGAKQVTIHVPDRVVEVEGMIPFRNQNCRDLPLRLCDSLCHDLANLRKRTQYQFSDMNKSGNDRKKGLTAGKQ